MTPKLIPIRLSALYYDQGIHHPDLLGGFVHNQLTLCRTADGAGDMVEWRRKPAETAEGFEKRIIEDLLELMGVVQKSSIDSERHAFVGEWRWWNRNRNPENPNAALLQ